MAVGDWRCPHLVDFRRDCQGDQQSISHPRLRILLDEIVLVAGLAATFAESVGMGAVAYISTLADADFYESERSRECR
jgi:hypothetical protein